MTWSDVVVKDGVLFISVACPFAAGFRPCSRTQGCFGINGSVEYLVGCGDEKKRRDMSTELSAAFIHCGQIGPFYWATMSGVSDCFPLTYHIRSLPRRRFENEHSRVLNLNSCIWVWNSFMYCCCCFAVYRLWKSLLLFHDRCHFGWMVVRLSLHYLETGYCRGKSARNFIFSMLYVSTLLDWFSFLFHTCCT